MPKINVHIVYIFKAKGRETTEQGKSTGRQTAGRRQA